MRHQSNIRFHIDAIKSKISRMEKLTTCAIIPYDLVEIQSNDNSIIAKVIIDTSNLDVEVAFDSFNNSDSFAASLNHAIKHKIAREIVQLQKKLIAHQFELQLLLNILNHNK